jgi:beta-lactamase superfamily II metal-dependent hydrolase
VAVEALLLAEGGMASLNPPEWIGKLRPQVVLLSAGADDPGGQPDPETLHSVEGYTLLRTDRNGWIHYRGIILLLFYEAFYLGVSFQARSK